MTISFPEPRPGGVSLTQELSDFWSNGTTRKSWKYIETCRWYSDDNSWAFILLTELREDAVRFGESQAGLFNMHPEFSWEWRGACWIVRARQSSKSCFAWAWWIWIWHIVPTVWIASTEALQPCFCRSVTIYSEKMPRSNLRGGSIRVTGFCFRNSRERWFCHVFPCFFPMN